MGVEISGDMIGLDEANRQLAALEADASASTAAAKTTDQSATQGSRAAQPGKVDDQAAVLPGRGNSPGQTADEPPKSISDPGAKSGTDTPATADKKDQQQQQQGPKVEPEAGANAGKEPSK